MMRGLKRLLALLLVITLVIISFAALCFASATAQQDGTEKKADGGKSFSFADPLAMQEPPGDYIIRASTQWPLQRNLSVWRLVVLLLVSFVVLSRQGLLCFRSSAPLKIEFPSIFMASCHILRAPPVLA